MRLLVSCKFNYLKYTPPKNAGWAWIAEKANHYKSIATLYQQRNELKKAAMANSRARFLSNLSKTLRDCPKDFITYYDDEGSWIVEPLEVPSKIYDKLFGKAKVVLLSATIPPKWAKKVLGSRVFKYLDVPSPIPKENRKVLPRYAGLKASSSPLEIAQWIKKQLEEFKGNAIVHTTYSMGLELAKFFPGAHIHTKQTKHQTLKRFKRDGGLWIAAGASEGIDLSGDTGRVNLIPVIQFENNRNPLGQALFEKDEENYYLKAAVTLIQQAGRTTRGPDDYSVTVVGDNRMTWLLKKCDKELPKSFKEAIVWR
jgi:Rad3-related DNA helicase